MTRLRGCALVVSVVGCLLLSACASVIDGHPPPPPGSSGSGSSAGPPSSPSAPNAANAHLDVVGAAPGSCSNVHTKQLDATCFDQLVQNALSDVMEFWKREYPKISGGKQLPPIKGGLFSFDGGEIARTGHASGPAAQDKCIQDSPREIIDNGFYCRLNDSIAWDRNPNHIFAQLADHYGPFLVAMVFAHEFGHAISQRLGIFDSNPRTILTESQADCASGAWVASALNGQAPHFRDVTTQTVDVALEGYLDGRDGTPSGEQDVSHGNGFDRLSAIADGIDKGVTYCYGNDYFNRSFTERPYSDPKDFDSGGNQSFADTTDPNGLLVQDLNRFWSAAAKTVHRTFQPVKIVEADHPACETSQSTEFDYCPDDNTVYFSASFAMFAYNSLPGVVGDGATGDVKLVFNQPADFALGNLFSVAWGLAVRHQLFGGSMDDRSALIAATCYTGAYAKDVNVAQNSPQAQGKEIILSPADLDEATSSMLELVGNPRAFGERGTSGLDRVQAFVKGYNGGLHAC